jgi:hypothetical protein
MGRFRSRTRIGASSALLALALNLACSFGHHHFEDIARTFFVAEQSTAAGHPDDGDDDHHDSTAAPPCFACVVVTVAAIAADPPALPARDPPQTVGAAARFFDLRAGARTSFEARAPPLS